MTTKEELKAEYKARVVGATQEETQEHYLWYLKERYALDRAPYVFFAIQQVPHTNGLKNIRAYIEGKLTHRQLFDAMRKETADLYAQALADNGIANVQLDKAYYDMTEETALEGIKSLQEHIGLDLSVGDCPEPVATAAAVIWFRFMEHIHKMYELPTVTSLLEHTIIISNEEKETIESGTFDTFKLTDKERTDLKVLTGLSDKSKKLK